MCTEKGTHPLGSEDGSVGSVLRQKLAAQLPLIQSFDAPVLHRRKAW